MKLIITLTLLFAAISVRAQETNTTIFCNGAGWITNASDSSYAIVGGLFTTYAPPIPLYVNADGQFEKATAASLFPNPSTGIFSIESQFCAGPTQAVLYDDRGSFVLDAATKMTRTLDGFQFRLGDLVPGHYLLLVDCGKMHRTFKLTIQH